MKLLNACRNRFALALAAVLLAAAPARAELIVDITSGFVEPLPIAITVPLAFVQPTLQQLGASFTPFGAMDRAAQLEERQNFVREKYVFW